MPQHQLPPIVPRELRTRVAVPMGAPPVLKRAVTQSLIPVDVLQDMEREQQRQSLDDSFDGEVGTAPIPVDVPQLGTVTADLEVAYFALTQVPLFKDLPVASLEALAEGAIQLEVPDGEFL